MPRTDGGGGRAAGPAEPAGRVQPAGPVQPAGRGLLRWAALLPVLLAPAAWAVLTATNRYIGHDEGVYAGRARALVTDLPAAGWRDYRPPALPVLGAPLVGAGAGLTGLRVLSFGFTAFTLVLLHLVLRRWSDRLTGVLAVLVVLSAGTFQRRMAEYLNDILTAGLLLAMVALLVGVRRGGHPAMIPGAAAVAVLAFYVRYGVLGSLAAVVLAVLLVHGVRTWWRDRIWVLAAAAVCCAGVLPHLVWARAATGSPFGALTAARTVAAQVRPGTGLRYYLGHLLGGLAGWPATVVMLLGLAGAARVARSCWVQRRARGGGAPPDGVADQRWVLVLALAAVLQVVLLGISAHGEPRYVFFAVIALVAVGCHTFAGLVAGAGVQDRAFRWAIGLAVLAVVGATVQQYRIMRGYEPSRAAMVAVARSLAGTRPCVVASEYPSQLGWYSGCRDVQPGAALDLLPPGTAVHLVWFAADRSPTAARLAELARYGPVRTRRFDGHGRLGDGFVASVRTGS